MPYPFAEDARQAVIDLMGPEERLLFDALERQMELGRLQLEAYRLATRGFFIVGSCLTVSTLCLAAVLIAR